jgi:predicted Fe-Mo cluster-binding NifX family protein
MKIAFVTEDGENISQHFGRAPFFMIVEQEDNVMKRSTMIRKGGCSHGNEEAARPSGQQGDHEHADQPARHASMINQLQGCTALISGGMGMSAYTSLLTAGINAYITRVEKISEALDLFNQGKLDNNLELLH